MALRIEELNDTNCKTYLLTVGDEAALVDPVRERLDTYRSLLGRRGLKLRMVLETHMHADHLMFNRAAKDLLGATIVMHRESPSPLVDRHVDDGDVLTLGGERIEVLHTPGHTPDSVCYRVAGAVLTGDTLMVGGSGRTDFPGADAGQQYDAVHGRLFTLPDDTVVWPAHDYHGKTSTTIGEEKRTNPRYVGRSRAEYVTLMGSLGLPFPEKIQQSLQVNQSGFETEEVHFPMVADIAAMPVVSPEQVAAEQQGALAAAAARRARAGGVRRRARARQGRVACPAGRPAAAPPQAGRLSRTRGGRHLSVGRALGDGGGDPAPGRLRSRPQPGGRHAGVERPPPAGRALSGTEIGTRATFGVTRLCARRARLHNRHMRRSGRSRSLRRCRGRSLA